MVVTRRLSLAFLCVLAAGCSDAIEGEWVYRDAPDDLLLDAHFVAAAENPGEGEVLFDIEHVPNVDMAVSWWALDNGRYRIDFRCLNVPDDPDLGCESLNFYLECDLLEDALQCDYAGCSDCGTFAFERSGS